MKAQILILIALLANLESEGQLHGHGLKPPVADSIATLAVVKIKASAGAPRPVKPAVDLSSFFPTPDNQGNYGTCVSWALGYGITTYNQKQLRGWSLTTPEKRPDYNHIFSASFVYNHLNTSPACNDGLNMIDALKFVKYNGVAPWVYSPYTCSQTVSEEANAEARKYTISDYKPLYAQAMLRFPKTEDVPLNLFRQTLSDSMPILLGIICDDNFDGWANQDYQPNPPAIWDRFSRPADLEGNYHAVVCVGYDKGKRLFKIMNSWGTEYGNNGFLWVTDEVMKQAVFEAYSTDVLREDVRLATVRKSAPYRSIPIPVHDSFFVEAREQWIKKGYYRDYGSYRIGCSYLNARDNDVILELSEKNSGNVLGLYEMSLGDKIDVEHRGNLISLAVFGIEHRGYNIFKKAVIFEIDIVKKQQ